MDDSERTRLAGHLESCTDCFERYQDSAMMAGAWEAGPEAFTPDAVLINAGREVPSRLPAKTGPPGRRSLFAPPAWFKRFRLVNYAAAAMVLVLVAAMVWYWPGRSGRGDFTPDDPAIPATVRTAVETVSARGPFVLPGGEMTTVSDQTIYRNGHYPVSGELESSLSRLSRSLIDGDLSAREAAWLAGGYYATGQIDAARDAAGLALKKYADDSGLLILSALIAYTDGDDNRATRLLRGIPQSDPNHGVASLNLAALLIKMNNPDEARLILSRLTREFSGGMMGERAAALLADIQPSQ